MSKKLVAYFSASGVTERAAAKVAKAADADLFEIKPKIPYTTEDLNWMNKQSRSSIEMSDPSSRPEIEERVEGMEKYDVVFIGFPIWWYVAPTIINTFLESYDFSGKTIIPFNSHGGSGFSNTIKEIKKLQPDATVSNEGLSISRNDVSGSAQKIIDWAKGIQ